MPPSSLVSRLATASMAPAAAKPVSLQRHPPHGASAAHDDAPGVHQRVRAVPVDFTSSPRPPISGEAEKFVTGSPVAATEGPLTAPKGVWASTRPGLGLWHPFREGGRGQGSWRRRGPQELKARERRRLRVSIAAYGLSCHDKDSRRTKSEASTIIRTAYVIGSLEARTLASPFATPSVVPRESTLVPTR
ncbi:hypothetical protein GGF50DRAFT_115110 [Schizophyllum commune]